MKRILGALLLGLVLAFPGAALASGSASEPVTVSNDDDGKKDKKGRKGKHKKGKRGGCKHKGKGKDGEKSRER